MRAFVNSYLFSREISSAFLPNLSSKEEAKRTHLSELVCFLMKRSRCGRSLAPRHPERTFLYLVENPFQGLGGNDPEGL